MGVIRSAIKAGKAIKVIATETRPRLQGARLTAFELEFDKIPITLITDNMVGYVMEKNLIDKVIVGADRITLSGHVVNKIGTLSVAIMASYYRLPFYVAAPLSTFDLKTEVNSIIIEERSQEEVLRLSGVHIAPKKVPALNPAFDVTPPSLISAIVTEKGILKPPFKEAIRKVLEKP